MLLGYYYSKLACCWGITTADWHAAGVLIQLLGNAARMLLQQIGILLGY
jgi:hypothetical protein